MPKDEVDLLLGADWDIPLTETLVTDVQQGVRLRRIRRRAVAGAAAAVLAVAVVFGLGGSGTSTLVVPPATPGASATAGGPPLDGFRLGYVPSGARPAARDASFTCTLTAVTHECRDDGGNGTGARLSQRRYDKGSGGARMWVTVARPLPAPGGTDRTTQWLVDWLTRDRTQVATFDAPAGQVRVLSSAGSEVTSYAIVLVTDAGVVVSIESRSDVTRAELARVAQGLTRVR